MMVSKRYAKLLACVLVWTVCSGCATKRFGRMTKLTTVEANLMDCDDVQMEIAKCRSFLNEISETGVDGRDVLGFLGDFGIGNMIERGSAIKSGKRRLDALERLYAERCKPPHIVTGTP